MKVLRQSAAVMLLTASLLVCAAHGEVVDRTIAVVNREPITWSDLDELMRFEALENGRALKDLGIADRREAFSHLVQFSSLREPMQGIGVTPASDADVAARIADLRALWLVAHDDQKWNELLAEYGLTPSRLRALLVNQIEILRFMEFRVRPLVRVSRAEVESYYNDTLTPQVKAEGQTPEPLDALRAKIYELLVEKKMNQEIESWLQTLREQSRVRVMWDEVR